MENIITAIGNPILNEKLRELNKYNILIPDIQYQEGVIEILNKKEDINYLILSEILPGEFIFIDFIFEIKKINNKIKLIIFLENENDELKNILNAKGFFNVFFNNQNSLKEIINIIENKTEKITEKEMLDEINNLKKIILENKTEKKNSIKNKIEKNNLIKIIKNKIKTNKKTMKEKTVKNKIVGVSGVSGSGKSTFCINLANLINIKNKILIIDFNFKNNINLILGIKKYSKKINKKIKENKIKNKKEIKINNLIIKINKKINLISGIDIIFEKEKIEKNKIRNTLQELKEKYELIIIDLPGEAQEEYNAFLCKNCDEIIIIGEANLKEIRNINVIINKYINELNIKKEKISIIFNKFNKYSIDENLLKNIFSDINILGKINYSDKYNLLINKNKLNSINKKIKKQYKKIIKKVLENKKRKIKIKNIKEVIFNGNNGKRINKYLRQ